MLFHITARSYTGTGKSKRERVSERQKIANYFSSCLSNGYCNVKNMVAFSNIIFIVIFVNISFNFFYFEKEI
jgi:hypothetical protein